MEKNLRENEATVRNAIHEIDNPALAALTCTPDYLQFLANNCLDSLNNLKTIKHNDKGELLKIANRISHAHAIFVIQGKATSNTSPDIMCGEKMSDACKKVGEMVLKLLTCVRMKASVDNSIDDTVESLKAVLLIVEMISGSLRGETPENLADLLESEMVAMDKAIEEAANKIQVPFVIIKLFFENEFFFRTC